MEETRALDLGFSKEDVVGKEEHVGGSWTNVSFLCLLDLVENNIKNTITSHLRKTIGKYLQMF